MPDETLAGGAGTWVRLGLSRGLAVRVVSAVALGVAAAGANFAGLMPFAAFVTLLTVAICWEWGHMVRNETADAVLAVHAGAVAASIGFAAAGLTALAFATLVAGAGGVLLLASRTQKAAARVSALGVFYAGVPSAVLVWLREGEPFGAWAVLFVFSVVWAYDTMAFAVGRLLDGPKLWVRISPRKTWAGVAGGICGSAAAGAAFAVFALGQTPFWLAVCGGVFGAVAQAGDLLESALKRLYGLKDTSDLVPGHGGVMDRVDSMAAASVAAGLVAVVIDPGAPARALLFGN